MSFLRRFVGVVLPLPLTSEDESEPAASPFALFTLGVGEFGGSGSKSMPLDRRDEEDARMVEAFDDDLVIRLDATSLPRSSSTCSTSPSCSTVSKGGACAVSGERTGSSPAASLVANGPLGSRVELR